MPVASRLAVIEALSALKNYSPAELMNDSGYSNPSRAQLDFAEWVVQLAKSQYSYKNDGYPVQFGAPKFNRKTLQYKYRSQAKRDDPLVRHARINPFKVSRSIALRTLMKILSNDPLFDVLFPLENALAARPSLPASKPIEGALKPILPMTLNPHSTQPTHITQSVNASTTALAPVNVQNVLELNVQPIQSAVENELGIQEPSGRSTTIVQNGNQEQPTIDPETLVALTASLMTENIALKQQNAALLAQQINDSERLRAFYTENHIQSEIITQLLDRAERTFV